MIEVNKKLPSLNMSRFEAEKLIDEQIVKGMSLNNSDRSLFDRWDDYNNDLLKKIFNTEEIVQKYKSCILKYAAPYDPFRTIVNPNLHNYIKEKISYLTSLKERLNLYDELKQELNNNSDHDFLANCHINNVNLDFMTLLKLRRIVERDLVELTAAIKNGSNKSVLVLCGSILEGLLLDRLLTIRDRAEPLHPKSIPLERWQLNEIIDISGNLEILPTETIMKFSHGLREFRNLIHPGCELRDKLVIAPEEARIGAEVVNIVLRTLASTKL